MNKNRPSCPSGKPPLNAPVFPHAIVRRLRRVRLGAVGPFVRLDIQLSPRQNFIIGEGGSGKSSLIQALIAASRRYPTKSGRGGTLSAGKRPLPILCGWIDQLTPDRALLFDEDILGSLGLPDREAAFRRLSVAKGQIVAVLPRSLKIDDLVARKLCGLALVIRRDLEGSGGSSVDAIKLHGPFRRTPASC